MSVPVGVRSYDVLVQHEWSAKASRLHEEITWLPYTSLFVAAFLAFGGALTHEARNRFFGDCDRVLARVIGAFEPPPEHFPLVVPFNVDLVALSIPAEQVY